MSTGNTSWG